MRCNLAAVADWIGATHHPGNLSTGFELMAFGMAIMILFFLYLWLF